MASSDIVSSIKHPRYLTLECCLIWVSPYFKLSFLMFFFVNLEIKSIDFVLSSPSVRILSFSGPYSVHLRENMDQETSEYGHFSLSQSRT